MRLSEAFNLYEKDKRYLGYSPHTLKAYTLQSRLLIRYLGDVDVAEINYENLKNYLSEQQHLKPQSLGHRVRFLKSFFKFLHEEGIIEYNPARKLREPKIGHRIPKPLPAEDLELMTLNCKTLFEHALVNFLFSTGCRIGEIYKLNRDDIDWETKSVIIQGKGDKERECYFNQRTAILLKKYLQTRKDKDPALFVTERKPHRMSIAQMRYVLKKIANRAGIKTSVYPHKLRHSYACSLLNNGAPMELIQSLLGHAKQETTLLYASLSGPRRRELYNRYFR